MPIWTELSARLRRRQAVSARHLSAPLQRLLLDFGLPIFAFDSPSHRAKVEGVAHLPSPFFTGRASASGCGCVYIQSAFRAKLPPAFVAVALAHPLTHLHTVTKELYLSLQFTIHFPGPALASSPSSEPASDEVVARRISYKHESGLGKKWEISRLRATAAASDPKWVSRRM